MSSVAFSSTGLLAGTVTGVFSSTMESVFCLSIANSSPPTTFDNSSSVLSSFAPSSEARLSDSLWEPNYTKEQNIFVSTKLQQ